MVDINDNLVYTEDYVDNCGEHTHVIHKTHKESIENLEEAVEALRNQIFLILNLESIALSIKGAITSVCKTSKITARAEPHWYDLPLQYYITLKIAITRYIRRIRFILRNEK